MVSSLNLNMFINDRNALVYKYDSETFLVEAWGPSAFRIRATHESSFLSENWALTEPIPNTSPTVAIQPSPLDPDKPKPPPQTATITNGLLTAQLSPHGKLTITTPHPTTSTRTTLLEEFDRHRLDVTDPKCSALKIHAR